ncbi:hypothetical protein PENSPDRAFT_661804 [Peniophora sp. CONT]|nr:hypothetical protein PENSPDRAFT_661804 [Peniophora sp. CONT]
MAMGSAVPKGVMTWIKADKWHLRRLVGFCKAMKRVQKSLTVYALRSLLQVRRYTIALKTLFPMPTGPLKCVNLKVARTERSIVARVARTLASTASVWQDILLLSLNYPGRLAWAGYTSSTHSCVQLLTGRPPGKLAFVLYTRTVLVTGYSLVLCLGMCTPYAGTYSAIATGIRLLPHCRVPAGIASD